MKDLAVRAHLALERAAGRKLPVRMKLEKRIPVGGGGVVSLHGAFLEDRGW
ncbi:MAG: hypothetical protein ACKOJI_09785 [Phycisphaerales bacterium]